jgi:hemoglobin-like flavoprotein
MNILDKYKCKDSYPKILTRQLNKIEKKNIRIGQSFKTWSFIGCFENYYNEVMITVVAYRYYKKTFEHTQVLIACPKFDYKYIKDCYPTMFGYKVWKGYSEWEKCENRIMMLDDCRTTWLNEVELAKYKYSCWEEIETSISNYLRFYEKYPNVEKIIKCGFDNKIVTSKLINKQVAKDKAFLKFMCRNKKTIEENYYLTIPLIVKGYKQSIPLFILANDNKLSVKVKSANSQFYKQVYKKYPKIKNLVLKKYNLKQTHIYCDYIMFCVELGLDLIDSKNYNPKELQLMHDLRFSEIEALRLSSRMKESIKSRKERIIKKIETDMKIKEIAKKHLNIEYENEFYRISVAKDLRSFYTEAKLLKHCLYKGGYPSKVARGRTLILYLRRKEDLDKPYITIEYDPKHNKVWQQYGYKDRMPDNETIKFIEEWNKNIVVL